MADDMTYGALAVASRRRVLEVLRQAGTPQDATALAQATGLHPNTVRFHLKVLIDAGYVVQTSVPRGGPGRPQAVYAGVTPAAEAGGYALLAEMLAGQLDGARGAELAERAGRRWLRHTSSIEAGTAAAQTEPDRGAPDRAAGRAGVATLDEAVARAMALFAELGFDPERTPQAGAARIELHACPFLDVARRHPDVVCGVHLGLLRGTVDGLSPQAFDADLHPFVRPGVCAAEIRAAR
ncbi:helix-turn-helix domain-containing protein [Catellatospora sp. NPDC049133]|uniref:helix-turn-helix transcriptional regulator n=1 Tax=Catellatospora sp. NPDC049133 TaxID=3155499 RepID=UPI0033FDF79E